MSELYLFKFLDVPQSVSNILTANLFSLIILSTIFAVWKKFSNHPNIKLMNRRMKPWWMLTVIGAILLFSSKTVTFFGLGFISFIALRELLSSLDLLPSDRKAIFWAFITIPIQYWAAYKGHYQFFLIFIPSIMFMILPFRKILNGNATGITRSIGILHWSVMLTVFSVSHIGFLFSFPAQPGHEAGSVGLILYLIILTEFNDILQYVWSKLVGKNKIIPKINPNKTWEGLVLGILSITLMSYMLRYLTFFTPTQSIISGLIIGLVGFIGDVNISAVKRDNGIGRMDIRHSGNGGVMDRLDSLSLTSVALFHLAYYWRAVV